MTKTRRRSPRESVLAVGSSTWTPGKHSTLNALVGREVGALSHMRYIRSYALVDLTAGDGVPNAGSGTSSPEILLRHRDYLRARRPEMRVTVTLVERAAGTYTRLAAGYVESADKVIHGDARLPGVVDLSGYDAAFINNDPNSIMSWAVNLAALGRLPPYLTTFSALGCNAAGGPGKVRAEHGESWRSQITDLLDTMPSRHDAFLAAIDNDAHRWGYLVTGPTVWKKEYETTLTNSFAPILIRGAWYRDDRRNFDYVLSYLIPRAKDEEQLCLFPT